MSIMTLPQVEKPTTVFGVHEYLAACGGTDLVINFAAHAPDPAAAFDLARAYGNLLRSRLREGDPAPPEVVVKGSRVYLISED